MHPRHEIGREYHVRVRGVPDERGIERLRKGIALDGERTAPATVEIHKVIESTSHGPDAILSMVIYEGRNRQVRRMCEAIGHPVSRLKRVRIGPINDDHIRPGEFRDLDERGNRRARSAIAAKRLLELASCTSCTARARAADATPERPQSPVAVSPLLLVEQARPRTPRGPRSPAPRRTDRPRRG